jgi:hypothetical protein
VGDGIKQRLEHEGYKRGRAAQVVRESNSGRAKNFCKQHHDQNPDSKLTEIPAFNYKLMGENTKRKCRTKGVALRHTVAISIGDISRLARTTTRLRVKIRVTSAFVGAIPSAN